LRIAANGQPNNALYQAVYNTFANESQDAVTALLLDQSKFPLYGVPSALNYCTHYLYQRDEKRFRNYKADDDGCITRLDTSSKQPVEECGLTPNASVTRFVYNRDWLPCADHALEPYSGADFLFASAWVLGTLKGIKH
jgi:hypothetical protein